MASTLKKGEAFHYHVVKYRDKVVSQQWHIKRMWAEFATEHTQDSPNRVKIEWLHPLERAQYGAPLTINTEE